MKKIALMALCAFALSMIPAQACGDYRSYHSVEKRTKLGAFVYNVFHRHTTAIVVKKNQVDYAWDF